MNDMNDIMNVWIADCVKIYGCFASVIRSRLFLSWLWDLCPVELGEVRGLIRLRRARYSQEGLKAFYRRPLNIVDFWTKVLTHSEIFFAIV